MAMARDLFVFQMFTGLAYSDAQNFDIGDYKLMTAFGRIRAKASRRAWHTPRNCCRLWWKSWSDTTGRFLTSIMPITTDA